MQGGGGGGGRIKMNNLGKDTKVKAMNSICINLTDVEGMT